MDPVNPSFDEIYEGLFPPVYRFVRLRVPLQDADDVTAESLAKIWQALPNFAGRGSLKTWAIKIAYHTVSDYYRARKGTPALCLEDASLAHANITDPGEELATVLAVGQTLAQLTGPQVAVIQLRLIEGFSAAEAAEILGLTQQAVDSLLYRAKKSFRSIYQGIECKGVTAL